MTTRFQVGPPTQLREIFRLDHIDSAAPNGEAWYRVFVTGFQEQKITARYCDTLLQAGQGCKVVPDQRGGQKSSFLGRSQ